MSFNRPKYDDGQCKAQQQESVAVANYVMNAPVMTDRCFQKNSLVRPFMTGNGAFGDADVESELLGITRRFSKCPSDKFIPQQNTPTVGFSMAGSDPCNTSKDYERTMRDCEFPSEIPRSDNPASNLRGKDTLRLDPLIFNPQDRILFSTNPGAQTRSDVRDNHKPCLPDLNTMFGEFMPEHKQVDNPYVPF